MKVVFRRKDCRQKFFGGCLSVGSGNGNYPALFLQAADDGFLPVRQHIGDDLIDTGLAADGLSGPPVITGQHNDMDAHIAQFTDLLSRIFLDGKCSIAIIADATGAEIEETPAKDKKCPFSIYGRCDGCALYNKGCAVVRLAAATNK